MVSHAYFFVRIEVLMIGFCVGFIQIGIWPFKFDVITIVPWTVRPNIGNSAITIYMELPEWKL